MIQGIHSGALEQPRGVGWGGGGGREVQEKRDLGMVVMV